mmetsp:Transcript_6131/g.21767  ORF Transcript_6131/g.21767 Transcript_6131/m.21767 type:complete len:230 (-) Transcript_6131:12-701(-)
MDRRAPLLEAAAERPRLEAIAPGCVVLDGIRPQRERRDEFGRAAATPLEERAAAEDVGGDDPPLRERQRVGREDLRTRKGVRGEVRAARLLLEDLEARVNLHDAVGDRRPLEALRKRFERFARARESARRLAPVPLEVLRHVQRAEAHGPLAQRRIGRGRVDAQRREDVDVAVVAAGPRTVGAEEQDRPRGARPPPAHPTSPSGSPPEKQSRDHLLSPLATVQRLELEP